MKKLFTALIGASAMMISVPALANDFGGVYGEVVAGVEDVTSAPNTSDINYGANVGVNVPVGKTVLGVEANFNDVFENTRDIGASARVGYVVGKAMPYVKAGYANYKDSFNRELDGLRLGGGVEYNLGSNSYIKAEYRYTDFEAGVGKHGGLIGIGFRF